MDTWMIWSIIIVVSLVGACGNILWKMASDKIGQISLAKLFDIMWDIRTLFTPIVFFALFLMFVGRFASIVPVGYMGATQLVTLITILTLGFTAIFDVVFLKVSYPVEVWIGVAIGLLAVYFIGRGL